MAWNLSWAVSSPGFLSGRECQMASKEWLNGQEVERHTRMCYDCELPVGLLDLKFRGIRFDAQGVVIGCINNHGDEVARRAITV
jgi:hypothetical protein